MAHQPFTQEKIDRLSIEMDAQLLALRKAEAESTIKWIRHGEFKFPEPQVRQVENALAEVRKDPDTFWVRFRMAARGAVCAEGGVLNAQWKKQGDLSNKAVLEKFASILVAMGFSGNALQVLAVALGVIVVHLGVKSFCMEVAPKTED